MSGGADECAARRPDSPGRPNLGKIRLPYSPRHDALINDGPAPAAAGEPHGHEEHVLRLIAPLWTNQRTAEHVAIESSVVASVRSAAMRETGPFTRIQIIKYAQSRGWSERAQPQDEWVKNRGGYAARTDGTAERRGADANDPLRSINPTEAVRGSSGCSLMCVV